MPESPLLRDLFSIPDSIVRRAQAVVSPSSQGIAESLANPDAVLARDSANAIRERYKPQFDAFEAAANSGDFERAALTLGPVARGLAETNEDRSVLAPYYQRAARGLILGGADPGIAVRVEAAGSQKLSDLVDSAKAVGKLRTEGAKAEATEAWMRDKLPADVASERALAGERNAHAGLYGERSLTEQQRRPGQVQLLDDQAAYQRANADRATEGAALSKARADRLSQPDARSISPEKLLGLRDRLQRSILPGMPPDVIAKIQADVAEYDRLLAPFMQGSAPARPAAAPSGNVAIPGMLPAPAAPQAQARKSVTMKEFAELVRAGFPVDQLEQRYVVE